MILFASYTNLVYLTGNVEVKFNIKYNSTYHHVKTNILLTS